MSRTARKLAQALAEVAALREDRPKLDEALDIQANEIARLRKALVLQYEMWSSLSRDTERKTQVGGQHVGMPHPFETAPEGVRRCVRSAAELGIHHAKAALEGKL